MEKMKTVTDATMDALPDDALAAVLGRLPARGLAASRGVWKAWRAVMDERRLLVLPCPVLGFFVYHGFFFGRLKWTGPRAGDGFGFLDAEGPFRQVSACARVEGHCDSHVLLGTSAREWHVWNPVTRWCASLPCLDAAGDEDDESWRRAYLAFDRPASPQRYRYAVLVPPPEPGTLETVEQGLEEWPPASWTWHVFSSSTGRWKETAFVREGDAAGTALRLQFDRYGRDHPWSGELTGWYTSAYWQGELYVHCRGEYVARLSLSSDMYRVIKSPVDIAELEPHGAGGAQTCLGKSEKGVYLGAIHDRSQLRIWILTNDDSWALVHRNDDIKPYSWRPMTKTTYRGEGPWFMNQFCDEQDEETRAWAQQQTSEWDSDDDDGVIVGADEDDDPDVWRHHGYAGFVGFHRYKEVVFLQDLLTHVAVAFRLKGSQSIFKRALETPPKLN